MIWLCIFLLYFCDSNATEGPSANFIGCFKNRPSSLMMNISYHTTIDQCINECKSKYYRYAMTRNGEVCACSNYLSEEVNSTEICDVICDSCEYKALLTDVYSTGSLVPGPPRNVLFKNITDTSVQILWKEPKSHVGITSYVIKAVPLHTYSSFTPKSPEWKYPNDTLQASLITLTPGTKYNISLSAISADGAGPTVSEVIHTRIAEPSNLPKNPKIIKKKGSQIEIKIDNVTNDNGPITSYLVVVINEDVRQVFQEQFLRSYDEAKKDGINYYIAAELDPKDIGKNFIVGDGRYYGHYFNVPLDSNTNYNIIIGIVSKLNGDIKRAFSSSDGLQKEIIIVNNYNEEIDGDSPAVIIGLSIAIGLLSCLLVAGIIGFLILKNRVTTTRRHRLSNNQELSLQGPMIEVENNGYIHEEEQPTKANYYRNLKQKVKSIPYNQLKIEPTNLLGIGRFGRVNSGSLYENDTLIPTAIYSISDKKLSSDDKKNMLKDLDLLIKTGKHENIIALIGTCETAQVVLVVLEYVSLNLKDLLLGSRDSLPGRFSNMSEIQALDIAVNICKGMSHLEENKIIHKQLCARNILITNGFVPKISGYGLAQYFSHNNLPDYTRWTALEVFKGQPYTAKSDVWSFACLLWEICVLGGTPYGNYSNNEVPEKVIKGLRLPQMQYFSDDLYQIMLNCWQIDMDERPDFNTMIESLESLKMNTLVPYLNFNLYSSFQYEQFYPDMEIAVRPVF